MPKLPLVIEVIKTAATEPSTWHYTITFPGENWINPTFDVTSWPSGNSGFGTAGTPNATIGTKWSTSDIWLAREVQLTQADLQSNLHWMEHHDEDTEIFINGQMAVKFTGYSVNYELKALSETARSLFKPGLNRIAIYCHQTGGGMPG